MAIDKELFYFSSSDVLVSLSNKTGEFKTHRKCTDKELDNIRSYFTQAVEIKEVHYVGVDENLKVPYEKQMSKLTKKARAKDKEITSVVREITRESNPDILFTRIGDLILEYKEKENGKTLNLLTDYVKQYNKITGEKIKVSDLL